MRLFLLVTLLFVAALLPAQTLSIYSGNGQIVEQLFQSPVPLVVQATDGSGKPLAGVAIAWSSTPASNGTLVNMTNVTDANGLASTSFLGTTNGSIGKSFVQSTVTAKSATSSASFVLTVSLSSSSVGGLGAPPLVQLLSPMPGATLSGTAGSTIPGAIKVQVVAQSGYEAGQPIPNVGVVIPPNAGSSQPTASCNGPAGTTLTNSSGLATCDLILGSVTGTVPLTALVGDITYTPTFFLNVTPAVACTYAATPTSQSFGAGGGTSTVSVSAASACSWTAVANEAWLAIGSASNGPGNGTVGYSVAANSGTARAGTLTIAGQTISISQAGGSGPATLTMASVNLPVAPEGTPYSALLTAMGGTPPYSWSSSGLPAWLTLSNTTGILSGTPPTPGSYSFVVTVTDSLNQSASQSFTISVAGGLVITNSGFPPAVVGQLYSQPLTSSLGCTTPFNPAPVFTVALGTLPPGLAIQSAVITGTPTTAGTYPFTLVASNSCGQTAPAPFSIVVTNRAVPVLTPAPASLAFTAAFMSTTAPAPQTITLSPGNLTYTAAAATSLGGNWLTIVNPTGTTPGPLTVGVGNTSQLNVGTYPGSITVTSPSTGSLTVPVSLMVTTPTLNISPLNIAVTLPNAGNTTSQPPILFTTGGTPVGYQASVTTGGSWLSVTPNSGTTSGPTATLIANINAAGLTPGMYNGTITLVTAYGNLTVSVALTVISTDLLVPSPGNLSFTAAAGESPITQSLAISASGAATNVTFAAAAVNGSWLGVSPSSGTTPVTATVAVNPSTLAAGTYTGTITVQASETGIASATVPVSLTVTAPSATPQLAAVTNGASFVPGPVAPGELITIFGNGIGPVSLSLGVVNSSGILGSKVSDTQVLFDGNPAPIVYASTTQVAVLVPYEVASDASTMFQIVYKGVKSNLVNLKVVDASPAVFTLDSAGQGAILNQDSTVNSAKNGAPPGSIISIYATGAGQTNPVGIDGKIAASSSLSMPVLPVSVSIGGERADVLYSGDSPGLASGVLQVNARVPANLSSGTQVPVQLIVGSDTSPPVRMWIK